MTPEEREKLIDDCVNMTAILHGVLTVHVDRKEFEAMDDTQLDREWNWLYDMCYLK